MAKRLISFSEALDIVQTFDVKGVPVPFEVEFCTADRERGTGGVIIHYKQAILHVKGGRIRDYDGQKLPEQEPKKPKKHRWNRLIRGLNTDQIRSMHAHLILTINGHSIR